MKFRECTTLKKKLADEEEERRHLENELKSLQRRHADTEDRLRARERASDLSVEDVNRDYKRLEEMKRILQSRVR